MSARRLPVLIPAFVLAIVPSVAPSQPNSKAQASGAPPLPQLAGMVATPLGTRASRGGPAMSIVGARVTLTAAVTNPTSMDKGGWCEMTFARAGGWTKTGGSYANGSCSFPAVDTHHGRPPLDINVRGCNATGCKESPVWVTADVDDTPPSVVRRLNSSYIDPPGAPGRVSPPATIAFSEPLAQDMQQRIETALAGAADHALSFAWAAGPPTPAGTQEFTLTIKAVQIPAQIRQKVVIDLVDPVGNVRPAVLLADAPAATTTAAAPLPELAGMVATPLGTRAGRGGQPMSIVGPRVSLTAAVTNPTAMGKDGWCELTFSRAGGWTKTGGSYANGTCSFPAVDTHHGHPPLDINVRGCNATGCKESPVWVTADVDDTPPSVLHALSTYRIDGAAPPGRVSPPATIVFTEPLARDMQQRIETAIAGAADHALTFAWSAGTPTITGTQEFTLTIKAVQLPAEIRQKVMVDLVDPVGNVRPGVVLAAPSAATAAASAVPLPELAGMVATPLGTRAGRGGQPMSIVGARVTLTAAVTNPTAMGKDGWCELTFSRAGGWTKVGGSYANGSCSFPAVDTHHGRPPFDINVRGCNATGCKESPVWVTADVDDTPPSVLHALSSNHIDGAAGPPGRVAPPATIVFTEPLARDMQQRIETAIAGAADHALSFAWSAGPMTITGTQEFTLTVKAVQLPERILRSVTIDLVDPVGNMRPGVVLAQVP